MLNVAILLVIILQLIHAASHKHRYDTERDKRDLLDELEELLIRHRNRTETCGPSVGVEKLELLKEKMDHMSNLMDEIYEEAESGQGSEDSRSLGLSTIAPTQPEDTTVYTDCAEVYKRGHKQSGVYTIINNDTKAYCNMDIEGGGWTVFQRRFDGSVDFNRTSAEYREGFGDVNGEYWLGLDHVHHLSMSTQELYILLEEFDGTLSYARYGRFGVESEANKYRLHVSQYNRKGKACDGLRYHNAMEFSTKDRDNDKRPDTPCTKVRTGAWWYKDCMQSNLNGKYRPSAKADARYSFSWFKLQGTYHYFLKGSMMMMRPTYSK